MNLVIEEIIEDLQKFYNKQLNDVQIEFWRSQLAMLDENDLCAGVMTLKGRESTAWMPNISTIKKYTLEAREIRLNQEKAKAPTFNDLERTTRSQHGRDSIDLMMDLNQGRIGRVEYIARMREMGNKYPKFKEDWDREANELEAFWASEEKRYAVGKEYLTRIWKMQDEAGFPSFNNPDWYLQRKKANPCADE